MNFRRLDVYQLAIRFIPVAARIYFGDARGSAMECAAIVDAAHVLESIDHGTQLDAIELLDRVVRMLSRLCLERQAL